VRKSQEIMISDFRESSVQNSCCGCLLDLPYNISEYFWLHVEHI
jgi:hypothetical protein